MYEVTLSLLAEDALTVTLPVAFAPDIEVTVGNLIGLDVLEHFDFGLSHRNRLGYMGRDMIRLDLLLTACRLAQLPDNTLAVP